MRRLARFGGALAGTAMLTASLLTSCSEPLPETSSKADAAATACSKELLACARRSTLADLVPKTATKATGTPIRLGMVNQENTAAGSYPELSQAVMAATAFINGELGGVDGRPIEVEVCNTEFSAEGSTARSAAVEKGAKGGIDARNAIDTSSERHPVRAASRSARSRWRMPTRSSGVAGAGEPPYFLLVRGRAGPRQEGGHRLRRLRSITDSDGQAGSMDTASTSSSCRTR